MSTRKLKIFSLRPLLVPWS